MRGSCAESLVTFDSIRLEMSSSLEQDYNEFKFSRENQLEETDVEDKLENFSNLLDTKELESCEICEQKFQTKKDLQTHVLIHLGKPRVVLKRIANVKTLPKKEQQTDNYWLGSERRGNLKITLKKNSGCDSLKLKLKKSPESESFTVISNNFDLDIQQSLDKHDELAETQDNDTKSDSDKEENAEQDFENVMLNQENNYSDDNFESEPSHNPLESSERPSMDNNEGDSGVGSDFVNPLDKDDQNDNDSQADNASNQDLADVPENEDNEETDALEACRETIENLKKLGEQSSSRSSDLLEPTDVSVEEEDKEEEREEEEDDPMNAIEELRSNREISIVPKASLMPDRSTNMSPGEAETEIVPINWNKCTEDSRSRSRESSNERGEKESPESSENTGSLLQNFLIEQQRNQNESNSNAQSFETEYVSLERLAETVNTCRVCNEKFKDIAHLDAHRSKAGHYQCNIPDCSSLVFNTSMELSVHKTQVHVAPISPRLSNASPHLSQTPPHPHSPHLNRMSPHVNAHSPHSPNIQSAIPARNSPITSPHTNSPTYGVQQPPVTYPPVNLEQLPAPVQQLAQQVQRMPLPQPQMPSVMPSGANTMIPGPNYYPQPPGRPPMYRVQTPMQYPPHLAHLYQQYNAHYQQLGMQQQMQPQIPQQMTRGRYPAMVPGQRAPRMPQSPIAPPVPRQRMKRPLPSQPVQMQQSQPTTAKRRMDVLIPDRNEDADCHVIAQQKRNDGLPVIQNVQGGTSVQSSSRNDSTIHLTDSITLSVRQPGPHPAQVNAMVQSTKKSDASAVANVLAARGITVTPATNKKLQEPITQQQQQQSQQQQQQKPQPLNVSALNLNSAISIIPASSVQRKQQEQQGQFAIPQNKQAKQTTNEVERPPRPPTVDLTQDAPSLPVVRRGRPPRMLQSLTCNVCDKRFQSQEMLSQHMATHRTTNKLLHKCNLCPAQYPTATALATHKKTYHKEVDATPHHPDNIELALPVVDLKSQNTLNRLASLGIQSYIPLSQLSAQTGGYFGLPIITVDGARNSNTCNLGALGATSILSLGPLKHLSNR
ncbi:putative uncharacterized protein DDB_G0291608 isoform X2 [Phymastichus coffea]|uniref:putative uncharacterized protein DDB_G0291608 isoform X2 n=1 Tax=Phymastichus coffea TaxID=108790 RepID=UPI00273B6FE1|nr:putative uncharacterized protein DDB_G0291608 isoform X2 [Phymastichus coffea]